MKKLRIFAFCLLVFTGAKAQLVYNNGSLIYSAPSSLIKVGGSVNNSNSGIIEHNGLIIIDSTFTNNTTGKTQGNGSYDVYLHWINSGLFLRDTSTVNLKGSVQDIKGDSVSRFYNLNLLGAGEKRMYINSEVHNKLDLTNNELATQQDTMFLLNGSVSSLSGNWTFGSEGFISNLDSGAFVRLTNSIANYYYPMGNKTGTQRFRPVQIKPALTTSNKYILSFYNTNPTGDGFNVASKDTVLCRVNDKFYHQIGRFGTSPADIEIGYLQASDTYFNTIGNWRGGFTQWDDITLVSNTSMLGAYNSNKRLGWSSFNDLPYSLANVRPTISAISGNTLVCGSSVSTYSFTNDPNFSYDWSVLGGQFVNNDSTSSTTSISWTTPGPGYTQLTITDNLSGCVSETYTNNIMVGIGPTAGFNLLSPPFTAGNPIQVQDASVNAVSWYYDLGNGTNASTQNANTMFSNTGEFVITQVVTDQMGCTDTLSMTLVIENGLSIPNVFTPNGDGTNDAFSFNCNGCDGYNLEIQDRWGVKMYQGNKGSAFWDGRNAAGEKVSNGTYFYILEITYGTEVKKLTGFIQLFN